MKWRIITGSAAAPHLIEIYFSAEGMCGKTLEKNLEEMG